MDKNDKYKHYSAADIRKYLRGDLSAREMQALEAAALEDPFLADALEGMEKDRLLRGEDGFQDDMDSLKDRLAQRVAEKDKALVMPLYRSVWKVAAAVILLAGMGSIAYRYLFKGHSSTPALARMVTGKETPAADSFRAGPMNSVLREMPDSGRTVATRREDLAEPTVASQPVAARSKKTDPPEKAKSDEDSVAFKNTFADAAPAAGEKITRAMPAPAAGKIARTTPAATAERTFGNKDYKASGVGAFRSSYDSTKNDGQFLVGKVTDGNNNPIPLITIDISGQQHTVRTDTNGLFRIQMLGSGSPTHIRIGSTGFESVEVPAYVLSDRSANGGIANTIRLQPQGETPGYATINNNSRLKKISSDNAANMTSASATPQNNIVQQAAPNSGWPVFKSYLEKNKMARSIDSTRKGMEAISFKVNRKGHLSSFKIESSLSPAHDSLLLHLIKHGPAWKALNGNNSSATVILSY